MRKSKPIRTGLGEVALELDRDPELIRGLASRLRFTRLLRRFPERRLWASFMFVNGFITIALLAAVTMISGTPFVFPSLGSTAILLFETPSRPTASPRNTLYGHAIAIVFGYGSLLVTGLEKAPTAMVAGVDYRRIFAAALSLALTSALLILLKSTHPPAGATALIVSMGIVTKIFYLFVIEIAASGLDYPLWAKTTGAESVPKTIHLG
jgi:CBS domain-containing membrane protein